MKQGLAFGVGALIFLLTLLLAARRIIGFNLTIIFLLIALGASMGIKHQDFFVDFWNKGMSNKLENRSQPASEAKTEPTPTKMEAAPAAILPPPAITQPPPASVATPPASQLTEVSKSQEDENQNSTKKRRKRKTTDDQKLNAITEII